MKKGKKIILVLLLLLSCGIYSATAQVYIKVRPHRPHYERVAPPSPRHVWVDDDWEPRNGSYVFVGGRWIEPPHGHHRWVRGHWRNSHRRGYVWVPGHWR